jgi:hypothetical protein
VTNVLAYFTLSSVTKNEKVYRIDTWRDRRDLRTQVFNSVGAGQAGRRRHLARWGGGFRSRRRHRRQQSVLRGVVVRVVFGKQDLDGSLLSDPVTHFARIDPYGKISCR